MASISTSQSNSQNNYASNTNTNVVSKEYYVKVPNRSKKRYHALKFHTSNVDMAAWTKSEMARDMTNQQNQRPDWETAPKSGHGSEFGREAKEQARRRKYGSMPKKINPEDQPWVLTNKSNEKAARQFIGKKSVSENSSYFVFIKCADGGFEAWPLEDWYSFAPHKTYKTLNHEEAEEEYKRRNKVLNKYTIMANKRKIDNTGGDEEEEGEAGGGKGSITSFGSSAKTGKDAWVSDGEDDSKKKKKKNYKSSNLSDDDEEDKDENEDDEFDKSSKSKKKSKRKDLGSDDEVKAKEDSDDGDHDGVEKDYSSSDSDLDSGPETSKNEEKYQQKGIDEEEAIKAQNKSDESESEEDEDLTEEGKEYKRKLTAKDDEENESDGFDDFFKGKTGKDGEESKDSSSSFDESDLESDLAKQKKIKLNQSTENNNKLKRKASDELLQNKTKKKAVKPPASSTAVTHDESSSSSSTSAPNLNKSSKTAAVIAAAAANANKSHATSAAISKAAAAAASKDSSGLSEEEVKRYLSRKPMTSKELLQKFKSKTQSTMSNDQLVLSLRAILDKLKAKMIEQNGVKYLSLP